MGVKTRVKKRAYAMLPVSSSMLKCKNAGRRIAGKRLMWPVSGPESYSRLFCPLCSTELRCRATSQRGLHCGVRTDGEEPEIAVAAPLRPEQQEGSSGNVTEPAALESVIVDKAPDPPSSWPVVGVDPPTPKEPSGGPPPAPPSLETVALPPPPPISTKKEEKPKNLAELDGVRL